MKSAGGAHTGLRTDDHFTLVIASAAAASAAMRFQVTTGVSVCLIASIVLLPTWWGALRQYRFGRSVIIMGALAVGWGVALALVEQHRTVSYPLLQGQTLNMLAFVGAIGLLLWCRSVLGVTRTAMWFGIGALADIVGSGVDSDNAWKFTFALPVAITVLGAAGMVRSRWLEFMSLAALGTMSLLSDSRSMTAFFALTIPIVAWQMVRGERRRRGRPWRVLLWFTALALAAFNLFQSLLLDGALGEDARQRTEMQIRASGSLITGARPEAGAAAALVGERPVGYGAGVLPSSTDIWTAKVGMGALGYDPDNGYVDNYMFGQKIEVHSVLGDLWISFGPLAAVFALLLLGSAIFSVTRSVTLRSSSAVAVYLLLLGIWDMFFSPLLPSSPTLALLFAITAISVDEILADRDPSGDDAAQRRGSKFSRGRHRGPEGAGVEAGVKVNVQTYSQERKR